MKAKRILSIMSAVFLLLLSSAFSEETEAVFEIHFLSVGTNDGILLRAGDECAFIDSGNYPEGVICEEYLKDAGVTSLKYYIGTHAHLDHVGGASAILSKIPAENIVYTYEANLNAMYVMAKTEEDRLALDAPARIPMNYGDVLTLGGATLTCVGPETYVPKYDLYDTTENNNSLLLHVKYGDISFFLTGDSPSWKVLQMDKKHPEVLKSTVIKAPHHRGGFDKSVYRLIDSEYFVFSTADTWLPQREQMKMAAESSDHILITADNRNGNIVFTTDGKTLSVRTEFDYDYSAE